MDADRWERVQALFHRALDRPDDEREAFLDREVGDAPELAEAVRALLAEDARGGSPLDGAVGRLAHGVLDGSVPLLRGVGPYRVLGVLGRGGSGVVYLAEHEDLGRRVAVKVLRDATLSPERRARFEREEQTLAALTHPAIARLYDADTLSDGTPYFVMEVVDGAPITDYCTARACTLRERLYLFRAACEAVQHAHRQAVIHRDLKPSNIFVTDEVAEAPRVKLLDFGIAKPLDALDASVTQTAFRLMTPAYAAPEQFRGESVGTYTDVYALGVVLYELLAGRHPVDLAGLSPGQAEAKVIGTDPPPPSSYAGEVDGMKEVGARAWDDLDVLCRTAMHKDRERRYPTVDALLRDVDRFLENRPLEARPDSFAYRAGKFVRRHRDAVAAAALVLAALAALSAFFTTRLAEQRNRAEAEASKAERVADYLVGLFEASDPYGADSLSVNVLLRQGAAQAEALDGQPAVQAQMLDALGRVHTNLSAYERADTLLRRAVALRRAASEELDLAASLSHLSILRIYTGDYDAAERHMREALALQERHLPPNHPDLATTLDNLGVILSRQGEYGAAEALYRLALRIRRAIYDAPHEDLGYSLNNLAVSLYYQGDYATAEAFYREALAIDRAVFGARHPNVATDLANLGKLLEERGDYTEAEALLTEALAIRRAALGEDHYETALSLSQLGGLYRNMGDHERAERFLREALALRERTLGPEHPSTATTLSHLGSVLQAQEKYSEAEPVFRRVIDAYSARLGERHRFTGIVQCNLADVLRLQEDLEAAETVGRSCVSILEEVHPEYHHELAFNRGRYGAVLTAQGRYAEAEALLAPSHAILLDHFGPDHNRTRALARHLAVLYEAWGKPEEATRFRP